MKRAVVGLVAAALAAGSVLTAAPAQAGPGDPVACWHERPIPPIGSPYQDFITINGFDVKVNPDGATEVPDPQPQQDWWGGYYSCVNGGTTAPVDAIWMGIGCKTALLGERLGVGENYVTDYVSYDPADGYDVTVHGNLLVSDLTTACL